MTQSERLQEELGDALERLGATVEERDELRTEVERLRTTLAEAQESSAVRAARRRRGTRQA